MAEDRASPDAIAVDVPAAQIADLVAALGDDFEVDVDMLRDALLNARSWTCSRSAVRHSTPANSPAVRRCSSSKFFA